MCLRYFSLLPASVTTVSALSIIEATAAAIGLQCRTTAASATSNSTAAMPTRATAAVHVGSLSVASRNNLKIKSTKMPVFVLSMNLIYYL